MEKTYEEKVKSLRRGSIIWGIIYGISLFYAKNLVALIPIGLLIAINILIPQRNRNGAILEIVFGWLLTLAGVVQIVAWILMTVVTGVIGSGSDLISVMAVGVALGGIFYGLFGILFILAGKSTIKEGKWFKEKIDAGEQ